MRLFWTIAAAAALMGILTMARDKAIDVIARTIWGEARGEGDEGMAAVAAVIMNRAAIGGWWGSSPIAVALFPWQFSAWNENDPNRAKVKAVTADDPAFARALEIATDAVDGKLPDITGGATHYHTKAIEPDWADTSKITADIGAHLFYKDIG
jgi:spore germination cell wall hydrolase CwlJ-like protein